MITRGDFLPITANFSLIIDRWSAVISSADIYRKWSNKPLVSNSPPPLSNKPPGVKAILRNKPPFHSIFQYNHCFTLFAAKE